MIRDTIRFSGIVMNGMIMRLEAKKAIIINEKQ